MAAKFKLLVSTGVITRIRQLSGPAIQLPHKMASTTCNYWRQDVTISDDPTSDFWRPSFPTEQRPASFMFIFLHPTLMHPPSAAGVGVRVNFNYANADWQTSAARASNKPKRWLIWRSEGEGVRLNKTDAARRRSCRTNNRLGLCGLWRREWCMRPNVSSYKWTNIVH